MSLVAEADTRTAVEPRAAGPQARTWAGMLFRFGLLATLLLALADPADPAGEHADRGLAGAVDQGLELRHERHVEPARTRGRLAGARRVADPDRLRRRDRPAVRHRGRDLPAGVHARHADQPHPDANIRNLAGVPSIVYGILGLVVFVKALRAITGPDTPGGATSPAASRWRSW